MGHGEVDAGVGDIALPGTGTGLVPIDHALKPPAAPDHIAVVEVVVEQDAERSSSREVVLQ